MRIVSNNNNCSDDDEYNDEKDDRSETFDSIKGREFHDRSSDCELLNGIEAWI
jgi:hypothetical protein